MRNIILGTDWGEDSDDCVAVRILARAHKKGNIKLLGIGINTLTEYSAPSLYRFLETEGVMCEIGIDKACPHQIKHVTYQKRLCEQTDKTNEDFHEAVRLYRKLISESEGGVEIIEIGFLQVICAVLASAPDDLSDKSGVELFKEKVTKIWIMGGRWDVQDGKEYNFCAYPFASAASHEFISRCPSPITFLGYEVGAGVLTGAELDVQDPLRVAMLDHGDTHGRESWDPMLTLLALTNNNATAGYETVKGRASVNKDGRNFFEVCANGKDEYVIKTRDDAFYIDAINNLIK